MLKDSKEGSLKVCWQKVTLMFHCIIKFIVFDSFLLQSRLPWLGHQKHHLFPFFPPFYWKGEKERMVLLLAFLPRCTFNFEHFSVQCCRFSPDSKPRLKYVHTNCCPVRAGRFIGGWKCVAFGLFVFFPIRFTHLIWNSGQFGPVEHFSERSAALAWTNSICLEPWSFRMPENRKPGWIDLLMTVMKEAFIYRREAHHAFDRLSVSISPGDLCLHRLRTERKEVLDASQGREMMDIVIQGTQWSFRAFTPELIVCWLLNI